MSVPAHAAAVDSTVTLPLASVSDLATAGGHVFISGGSTSDQIVVTSAAGTVQQTLDGLGGPTALLTGSAGLAVYAALTTGDAIIAINPLTLKVIATYPTGSATCPTSLAQSGRWLYFGYGCSPGQWNAGVGRIDLTSRTSAALRIDGEDYYSPPLLAASGSVLAVGQPDLSPATVTSFQVSSNGSLAQLSESDVIQSNLGSNLQDLVTTASGAELFTAAGSPYSIQQYATADLTVPEHSYPTTPYPVAVALSGDGALLAGGSDGYYDPDVFLFKNGVPTESIELNGLLIPGGLAWGPRGRVLYGITFAWYATDPPPPVLHVITPTG